MTFPADPANTAALMATLRLLTPELRDRYGVLLQQHRLDDEAAFRAFMNEVAAIPNVSGPALLSLACFALRRLWFAHQPNHTKN